MRELLIPVILELVDHHCQHLDHRVIYTLHSTIVIWVVGAGDNFPNPKKLVDGMRKLSANLEAVVREYAPRTSPVGNIPVDENASRALSCELGCSDQEHAGSAAETIGEEQGVGDTSRRDRDGAEVIDADGNASVVKQGHRDDGPTGRHP